MANPVLVFLRALVNIQFFLVLMLSSVVVNTIQLFVCATGFIGVSMYQKLSVNQYLANMWWDLFIFWIQYLSGVKVVWTGDRIRKAENAIALANHAGGIDFASAIIVATQGGVGCGHTMAMLKESLRFVPGIGFMNYFQGSLFMKRTWEKDEVNLTKKLTDIVSKQYPPPTWIALFPEGTRITEKKRAESWEFAAKNNLPKLDYVLIPRTKGFTFVFNALHKHIGALYDFTIGYEGGPLFMLHACLFGKFKTKAIHLNVTRYETKDLPTDEPSLKKWMMDLFVKKDLAMKIFHETGSFPGPKLSYEPDNSRFLGLYALWSSVVFGISSLYVHPYVSIFALVNGILGGVFATLNIQKMNRNKSE